ncbi:hypothetical protein SAMN04515692_11340 [Leifsonia sp. CL147]|nr:hypothetical protein SAMN04515694_11370 [Leifsonia sp. CL154]SFL80562.1 hypothetical protein SAMN04515692_11340 [Leifsonia sp. CL147]
MSADGERGSVTAEFAVALPAVLLCLALCVGAVIGAARFAGLTAAAAAAARLAGRGDDPGGASAPAGASMSIEREGGTVCVRMTDPEGTVLSGLGVRLTARACALDEGGGG